MMIDVADLKSVAAGLLAALVGYVTRMFSSEAKIKMDLSFIKGQLSQVLTMVDAVDKLKVDHVILVKDHQKTQLDLDAAHEKIRGIESDVHGLVSSIQE